MSGSEHQHLATSAFDEIEGALSATARGRAFLREYAARSRGAELGVLLDAVARLERQIGTVHPVPDPEAVRDRLLVLRRSVADARGSLAPASSAGRRQDGVEPSTADLPSAHQSAVLEIVSAAEVIQEATWIMREAGLDAELCDRLDEQATAIYAGCARHDEIGRRLPALTAALASIDAACEGLAGALGELPGPITAAVLDGTPIALTSGDITFVARAEDGSDEPASDGAA